MELPDQIIPILLFSTGPGGCGGIAAFLYSLRKGHYQNNKYKVKLLIEISGAMIVASFVGPLFPHKTIVFMSFAVGLAWTAIIHVASSKINKIVKAAIGEDFD